MNRGEGWALVAILAIAAVARIVGLNDQLWYDEIRTLIDSVRNPVEVIVTHFPSNNNHVLYSLLAHVSIALGGETSFMMRLPAVIFGVVSVWLIHSFGREVTGRFEATSAALLAAVSYHHVWFSQNARGYTILLCVILFSTHMLLVGLKTNKRGPFLLFGLISALGAYTHLTMVLAVLGQAVVVAAHLLAQRRRFIFADWINPLLGFVVAAALTLLLYLPMLTDVSAFFGDPSTSPQAATGGWALLELVRGLAGGLRLGTVSGAAAALGGAVFLVGCMSYLRQSPMLLALFFMPGATVYFTSLMMSRPTFPRFFFFLAGFALLIIVRGVMVIVDWGAARLSARRFLAPLRLIATSMMVIVLLVDLPRAYSRSKQDYAGAAKFVEFAASPGDLIVAAGGGTAYPYHEYYAKPWPQLTGVTDLATRRKGRTVWVLRTFERYLQVGQPELLKALKTDCTEAKVFRGTLADGEIRVSRCAALP